MEYLYLLITIVIALEINKSLDGRRAKIKKKIIVLKRKFKAWRKRKFN
jgi:hypothetical protein